jgi:Zn finger protein HypA/HybF involved in hydrogenase expression
MNVKKFLVQFDCDCGNKMWLEIQEWKEGRYCPKCGIKFVLTKTGQKALLDFIKEEP